MVNVMAGAPQLVRLESQITGAKNKHAADCKRVERAAYLCRLGSTSEALSELDLLRGEYKNNPSAEISAWIHLADGLIEHFTTMNPKARDKMMRSNALSAAAGLKSLQALSLAWLAHFDYTQGRFDAMLESIKLSLPLSKYSPAAEVRVSLVVAQAYHFSGEFQMANPWYLRARIVAVREGDEATISALMHNMAWLRSQGLREIDCELAPPNRGDGEHALLGSESTENFDAIIGSSSLESIMPILRAQILTALGQYEEALRIFVEGMSTAVEAGLGRLHGSLLADRSWCYFNLGLVDEARQDALAGEAKSGASDHDDDLALTHARLAQTFDGLGLLDSGRRHRIKALEHWELRRAVQCKIVSFLQELTPLTR